MNSINIQIPSLSENIRIVESFIDNAKDQYKLDDDIYGNVMIAVTEAVNNAIKHGNGSDKNKMVSLNLALSESKIEFTIADEGKGFDFSNLPDPTAPENLDKTGGRGIFLMRHLCDEVSFKDNGKAVQLVFYFS
jgi:serine/threonine-protein kinase RsbW